MNKKGLRPLEVLLEESGDGDIEEILRASGAVSAENFQSSQREGFPHSWVVPVQDPESEEGSSLDLVQRSFRISSSIIRPKILQEK